MLFFNTANKESNIYRMCYNHRLMNRDYSTAVFGYQGGKSNISEWLVSHFPSHYRKMHYIEPFAGSLAVLFRKSRSVAESVSDLNENIYNFHLVLRDNLAELDRLVTSTLYCEKTWNIANNIYTGKIKEPDPIKKAWATYINFRLSFAGAGDAFGHLISALNVRTTPSASYHNNKKRLFMFSDRLKYTQIFNRPAEWFIERFINEETVFMYLDPPYPGTDQATYSHKFNMNSFNSLLNQLYTAKFMFMLSFYEKEEMELEKFKQSDKFSFLYKDSHLFIGNEGKKPPRRECILINYPNHNQQQGFDI